ncbi:MAG TPA: ABC transporter permease [Blastocatellia bacterium]
MINPFTKGAEVFRRLLYYLRRDKFDRELREEMDFHLEMKFREETAGGRLNRKMITSAARHEFGNQTQLQEVSREMWTFKSIERLLRHFKIETLVQDLRYALRLLAKTPGFTVAAIITLALGIGLNTGIFSVINSYLLEPMPYGQPNRLVQVWETQEQNPGVNGVISPANFLDWRKQASSFASLSAYNMDLPDLSQPDGAVEIGGAIVTPNFLDTLGVVPVIGRSFNSDEDQPGKNHVVIVSNSFWRTHMGSDANAIGQSLILDSVPFSVIGVLPAGYVHPEPSFDDKADLFRPVLLKEGANRGSHYMRAIGRLKSGVTVDQAQAEISTIASGLASAYPDINGGHGVTLVPIQKQFTGKLRSPLLIRAQWCWCC